MKLIWEGQEEFGSPTLLTWIGENANWLNVDYAYNADAMMKNDEQGLMWKGLKGASLIEISVTGANRVAHSGLYGGVFPNAAKQLSHILSSFHNQDGIVAVEGFYDNVDDITDAERTEIASISFDGGAIQADFDLEEFVTESGYTPQEIRFLRPTFEITGITSGIHGPGAVIPNEAKAWINCRLVRRDR